MSAELERWAERAAADRHGCRLPLRADAEAGEILDRSLALLFPHFAPDRRAQPGAVLAEIGQLEGWVRCFLAGIGRDDPALARTYTTALPAIQDALKLDAEATCAADPAASDVDEVILAYPGFHALACYRLAHQLRQLGVPLLPRLMTERAHRATGIDIHPGASIGRAIAIDHGTGIVVGETAVIGDRVRLYQGVTLGALSVRKDLARTRRHPTIEHDVVIYANATILGGDTVVGHSSVIGGNVFLTRSVPPYSVVANRESLERRHDEPGTPLEVEL